MRQSGRYGRIETLRVDLLHQLEPLDRRRLNSTPPNSTGVVDEHIEAAETFHRFVDQRFDGVGVAYVDFEGQGRASSVCDLSCNGIDG